MKSQSAPDASADTKARYLEQQYNFFFFYSVSAYKGEQTGSEWYSPTMSAHDFQNKSALVAVKGTQHLY